MTGDIFCLPFVLRDLARSTTFKSSARVDSLFWRLFSLALLFLNCDSIKEQFKLFITIKFCALKLSNVKLIDQPS